MNIAEKLTKIAENEEKVYEAGKEKAKLDFWDRFSSQDIGSAVSDNYSFAFAGPRWHQELIDQIPYGLLLGNCTQMFYYNENVFDLSKFPRGNQKTYNWRAMFQNASNLHTLWELDFSHTLTELTETFQNCNSLSNLTVVAESIPRTIDFQWCPLTKKSITSVVGGLRSDVTGQTCTFNKTAKEAAFTDSEWTALCATKSSWKIELI